MLQLGGARGFVLLALAAEIHLSPCDEGLLGGKALLDCEWDPRWVAFREKLADSVRQGRWPDASLVSEAQRLVQESYDQLMVDQAAVYGMSPGMQSFFLNCNSPPGTAESLPTPFCLYGAITALWVLAAAVPQDATGLLQHAHFLLGATMRQTLDFMESSSWPLSSVDVLTNLQRPGEQFRFPWHLGGYATPAKLSDIPSVSTSGGPQEKRQQRIVVWEIGVHATLSAEPLHMWVRALPDTQIVHRNLIQDQYPEWLPNKCETLYWHARLSCDTLRDDITEVFSKHIPLSATSNEPIESMDSLVSEFAAIAQARSESVDLFLCTIAYLCLTFDGLEKPILGYFGHPLLFMVPRTSDARESFWSRFAAMASKRSVEFACDGPFLQMQFEYQIGLPRLKVIRTHALYMGATHFPKRPNEVLLLDRPHESVLMCLIQRFLFDLTSANQEGVDMPLEWPLGDGRLRAASSKGYAYEFITRGMTDKRFSTFAQFRAVVLWPYDMDLITFYEFYSMAMPLFMPAHISKYVFGQHHMWYHGRWDGAVRDSAPLWPDEIGNSPFNETSLDAVRHVVKFADYFRFPYLQYFDSIPHLLNSLVSVDYFAIVQGMAQFNQDSLIESSTAWQTLLHRVTNWSLEG